MPNTIEKVRELASHPDAGGALQRVCDLLRNSIEYYDWVGFYLAYPQESLLLLGPFSGAPTEHLRIPYGRGICGQAADSRQTYLVPDVLTETNYLSCSAQTKAEIVVPIWFENEFVGELDIDSHTRDPFRHDDTVLLDDVVSVCAPLVSSILGSVRITNSQRERD